MKEERDLTCKVVRARLVALLDGECGEAEAHQIEAHLARCADCARLRDEYTNLAQQADAWQIEPADLWPAVQAQIELPDLADLREELQTLRAEVQRLRAEVAELRANRAAPAAQTRPSVLLPYQSHPSRSLHIA